jgi:hypothetical protein
MATGLKVQGNKITLVTADKDFTREEYEQITKEIIRKYGQKN